MFENKWMDNQKIAVVDLFCGVGGLTYGLRKEGLEVIAGVDLDSSCKFAYERNNQAKFINKSIEKITSKQIRELYPKDSIKVLVGCAPCQPFSTYNRKKKGNKDKKWGLLYEFLRIIKKVKPEIISMENVPQIRKQKVFKDFVKGLESKGYSVNFKVVNAARYGV